MSKLSHMLDKKNRMKNIYARYLTCPLEENTVLFESFHGKEVSDSPLAMARELLSRSDATAWKVYFASNNILRDQATLDSLELEIELVHIHSSKYAKLLATASYLVNNSSFPSYYIRRDGQVYFQTWHGTPLKALGKSMRFGIETMHNVQHNFLQANWLMFPNDFTRNVIMRDYNLDELFTGKVVMCGYPRNAIFSQPDEARRIKTLCSDDGISTLAYMPTWRGQDNKNIQIDSFTKEIGELLATLDEALTDNQKLYVNLHPIIQKDISIDGYRHIHAFPVGVDKYAFINSMDALITDYSSVFFDYSITGKPIILFTYDYEEYLAEHGLYFDVSELPFTRIDTVEDLASCLRSRAYEEYTYSEYSSYHESYTLYDFADVTRRLVDLIFFGEESNLIIQDYSANLDIPRRLIECKSIKTIDDLLAVKAMATEETLSNSACTGNADTSASRALVLFNQKDFTPVLSRYMHDELANSFDYIFSTQSNPLSYIELLALRILKDKKMRQVAKARNLRRRIGLLASSSTAAYSSPTITVTAIHISGQICHLAMQYPASLGAIGSIALAYRSSVEELVHPVSFTSHRTGRGMIKVSADVDLSLLKDGCVYWDFLITLDTGLVLKASLSRKVRALLNIGFYQCSHAPSSGSTSTTTKFISFPHIGIGSVLAFTHRERTEYDTRICNMRELVAYVTSKLLGRMLRKRKLCLVFEKFCSAAQDNGFYYFKYCMEKLPKSERENIYFVIKNNSPDYANLRPYKSQVIHFMSFKHLVYAICARYYVGSDSKKHLYIWRPKPNLISRELRHKEIHFLQHGVTALKRVDSIFGKHGSSPMTSITTTSRYEQRIMIDNFGYAADESPVVGFTRWDVLEDKSTPSERIILVMPTWRSWLEEKTDEDFLASDYFRNYMQMLQDESLLESLRENEVRLIFFIHPKFKDFLSQFTSNSDQIEFVQFGSRPLNEIMMHCSMLITDYSSVCWDVYYLGKPVVFYQFDYDMYIENHGSYLDMENELFGDRFLELDGLISCIKTNIENGFAESEAAKNRRLEYFEYIDSDNSKRTYEYLKNQYR